MFNFFRTTSKPPVFNTKIELHSHLLAGIDDGVKTWEESLEVLRQFEIWGIEKVITTPHIMGDFYPNTPEIIHAKLVEWQEEVNKADIKIKLEAAAEYYLDESFIEKLQTGEKLLTFGDRFLLFETSYINQPFFLLDAIFAMASAGYQPVMAHPERYAYLQDKIQILDELLNRGVLMQVNMGSIVGHYGKEAQKLAKYLITEQKVHFLGSDCHGPRHLPMIEATLRHKWYKKISGSSLLNNQI
jgi:protein-tyrosine phosphatase